MTDLRKALESKVLIGDGAMGTYLSQLGHPVGISYDELNLVSPEAIREVHTQYIQAGANVIETNTFSANAYKLSKFGLESKTAEINRAGVRIAREAAAGASAYVIGAVGSIRSGRRINVSARELGLYFGQQIDALLEEGVDGILLETFFDLEEMEIAVKCIRERGNVPIISQFAVDQVGRTLDGYAITDAFSILKQEGVDVVGFNCHSGPQGIMSVIQQQLPVPLEIPLSVYPNAGLASFVDGKYVYRATPAYFGERAKDFAAVGVRLLGGCCGTTPEHIAEMAKALADFETQPLAETPKLSGESVSVIRHLNGKEERSAGRTGDPESPTLVDLVKQRHTLIVELDPPRDLDITKFMEGAAALKEAGVDAVTMADNSLAVARMSNMALGHLVQDRIGLRTLAHIACRDRNLIGTQSHMMGFDALGINHVLAVTGDPSRFGDLPDASSVYDLTSFQIIKMIKQLNEGIAFSGKPLKHKANFVVGAAFNPNVKHLDKAVQRLEKKIASGADYVMTQPVYDPELIKRIKEETAHLDIPIFIGIMPLASGKNAEYLHNEVPGIELPESIRARMSGLAGEQGRLEGVEIAKELLDAAMEHFNGIYLMTPFLFYEMSVALAKYVQEKSKERASYLFHS
ncbi:bifunctional homocysteine S-methyltransferase/methylenetetrahydrofolate reductase [Paenibacillus physcomitrellae]|uniref:Bifunctional homocysteine S-methyltransferase/5,10-methylenetetrahydrofolate reductase n=1 Tax=Paenibacillus physcomitrellae TaxID=1619311 RepID=A0ABQ1FMS8_9BACL|nr:bifunctional homocysteine S-methyltransferase/methylenetetrahydrofolate reductase [Paenibacillus physcomitrellae]GGA21790.1 bifunctional homocysteine S-methyltransferase/5,10-methylenetetrahydrofolate reductase [Paenibacillus physcomitrellae]